MPATADAIVLFGATGDLARRMLLPSLYFLDADGFLPRDFRLIATARAELSTEEFLDQTHKALSERPEGVDDAVWARFSQRIVYVGADAWSDAGLHPKPYAAGTWGPSAAIALTERDGVTWYE